MQANFPTNYQDLQALLLAAAGVLAPMAEVGKNAAEGVRHGRFEVSESLSRGGAPTVLNRAGEAAAGGGADGGAGGVATGETGTGAGGNPETRLARTPPEDHVMGEAEFGNPIELLKN
jgi:hypothetical protein